MESKQRTNADTASNTGQSVRKEWRRLELRKLPIAATAHSTSKAGVNSCDGGPGCPKADASGQFS
jgi:hypothetical protein